MEYNKFENDPNGSDIARKLVHDKVGAGFNDLTKDIEISKEEYDFFER